MAEIRFAKLSVLVKIPYDLIDYGDVSMDAISASFAYDIQRCVKWALDELRKKAAANGVKPSEQLLAMFGENLEPGEPVIVETSGDVRLGVAEHVVRDVDE